MRRALVSRSGAALACAIALVQPHPAAAQDVTVKALIEAYNASGQQLFQQFSRKPGNIVFSPYSIGTAMAMALSGARGETATQMSKVLRQSLQPAAMEAANASVLATLNAYDKSSEPPKCPDNMRWSGGRCEVAPSADGRCLFPARRDGELCIADPVLRGPSAQLRVANALMAAQKRDGVSKEYSDLLKEKFGAEVLQGVDVNDVNEWVKRKTAGKIEKIIDQMPDVVLLNAIYFKARWASTFSAQSTQDKPFNVSTTQKVSVPTMARTGRYSVVSRKNYRAIRLPYDVSELGMIIVLPDKVDGIAKVSAQMNAKELSKVLAALRAGPNKLVALEMLRFKTSYEADDLATVFRKAGMTLAFDRQKANFSGITGRPLSELPFWIDEIRHRAVIEVMEDGTEAAAVTAVSMRASAIPQREPEPERFRVDRPFLYYIVDDATGAVLFQGRISNPK